MKRIAGLAVAVTAVALLVGCGAAKKVAIKINQDIVAEDDFYQRVQDLDAVILSTAAREGDLQKAGEVAMQSIISEHLILQVAAAKGITPTEQDVRDFVTFAKKYPQLSGLPRDPIRTDAELAVEARTQIAFRKLAAQPLKLQEADYQKTYDGLKARLVEPDQHKLRIIGTSTQSTAAAAAAVLKKGVSFETVAFKYSEDPAAQRNSGDIGWIPDSVLPAEVLTAIKALKPGQYTPTPVMAMVPKAGSSPSSPGGVQKQARYYIVKVEDVKVGRAPALAEIRPFIEMQTVSEKDRGAVSRVQLSVRDQLAKANIQVNLKRYEKLVARLKSAASQAAQPPMGLPGAGRP